MPGEDLRHEEEKDGGEHMPATHAIPPQRHVSQAHPYNLQQAIERFERGYIANILELTRWNHRKTARLLGISTDALTAKMRDYQLGSSPAPSRSRERRAEGCAGPGETPSVAGGTIVSDDQSGLITSRG